MAQIVRCCFRRLGAIICQMRLWFMRGEWSAIGHLAVRNAIGHGAVRNAIVARVGRIVDSVVALFDVRDRVAAILLFAGLFVLRVCVVVVSAAGGLLVAADWEAVGDRVQEHDDDQLDDLDESEQAHAEEQVQVAAERAEKVLGGHLRILERLHIRQAVVEHVDLHQVVEHVRVVVGLAESGRI